MDSDFYEIAEVLWPRALRVRRLSLDLPDEDGEVLLSIASSKAAESIRASERIPPAGSGPTIRPQARSAPEEVSEYRDIPAFLRADDSGTPPPWKIGFSKQFKKDTSGLDRRLLGRVLEILEEMSSYVAPFKSHGDTFKPLTGPLEGCWRYRIGDHRLVIQPVLKQAQLNALALGARGSIYD